MIRFFATFTGILVLLFGLELLGPVQHFVVLPWTALLARCAQVLVGWFDSSVVAQGKVLLNAATGFGVSIEPGCNGVEAFVVLCAAVLAYPVGSWRQKLAGLVVGFAAIQSLNIVRVVSLFYLGQWSTAVFEFAHIYVWQALIMLDVLLVWMLWARMVAPKPAGQAQNDSASPLHNA